MSTANPPTFDPTESQQAQGSSKPPEWKQRIAHLSIAVFVRDGSDHVIATDTLIKGTLRGVLGEGGGGEREREKSARQQARVASDCL